MPPAYIVAIIALVIAHLVCDAYGIPMGRQVRWLFLPFVWLIYGLTIGRVDFRKCKACKEREEFLDEIFGTNNKENK